jgi:two-component sensor histidine kinase
MSMALVHDKLYQTKNLANIDLDDYLKNLTDVLFISYGVNRNKIKLNINVEIIPLGVDTAIHCGLIINELVSNSLKHAFPGDQSGEIRISLRSAEENEFELVVSDNGTGLPKDMDFRNTETFGLQMVNLLVEGKLRGSVKLNHENGTEFQIRFKEI